MHARVSSWDAGSGEPIRLVIADDHPLVLAGLQELFSSEPGFEVVAHAKTGQETVDAVRAHRPHVLVLDLRMPDKNGIEVLRELPGASATTRVVLFTALESGEVLEAIHLGVDGVVLKDMPTALLVRAVREVATGRKWIEKALATRALDELLAKRARGADKSALTERELELARLVAQGLSNKAIALRLDIAEGTVKLHLHHIYQKLGVKGRVALVFRLRERRLI